MVFSKLKALLRKAAARSAQDLEQAIADALDQFTPNECSNYFVAAGYDRDLIKSALGRPYSELPFMPRMVAVVL
jgi:hypothetical protein